METAISIIIALIIFGLLVLIHEFGHFIVAKKNGVFVNEFSVGMGPRILSKVAKSGTRYSLKVVPVQCLEKMKITKRKALLIQNQSGREWQ